MAEHIWCVDQYRRTLSRKRLSFKYNASVHKTMTVHEALHYWRKYKSVQGTTYLFLMRRTDWDAPNIVRQIPL